jgi:lysophospholipase L1-like esterase
VAVPVGFLFASDLVINNHWDTYYAVLAWITAAAIFSPAFLGVAKSITLWTVLAMTQVLFSSSLWLAAAYLGNHWLAFYLQFLFALILLVLIKLRFCHRSFSNQVVNTLILLVAGFPLAELILGAPKQTSHDLSVLKNFRTYHGAQKNPAAHEQWVNLFDLELNQLVRKTMLRDPTAPLPYKLRPGTEGILVQSHVSINSKGFRGREIREPKGNLYRIVALGESTTFGMTLGPEDKPWPELLEQLIHDRLEQGQRVEVVNAGVPSLSLAHNLLRFKDELLPLQPDMIISLHGFNGFGMLNSALPPVYGPPPPRLQKRPSRLLAACEYRLKLAAYRRHRTPEPESSEPSHLLETDYARAYLQLISLARTNHIRLALANYPMAVNDRSPAEVMGFFHATWPGIRALLAANAAHSLLVKQLTDQNPDICFVDTHPNMDGDTDKFMDLVHYTEDGERQMAQAFFEGIQNVLREDLSRR